VSGRGGGGGRGRQGNVGPTEAVSGGRGHKNWIRPDPRLPRRPRVQLSGRSAASSRRGSQLRHLGRDAPRPVSSGLKALYSRASGPVAGLGKISKIASSRSVIYLAIF
jgi:hypothetical protein